MYAFKSIAGVPSCREPECHPITAPHAYAFLNSLHRGDFEIKYQTSRSGAKQ